MSHTRKIITGIILCAAIAGCFIAFKKEGKTYVAENAAPAQGDQSVKGTETVAGAAQSAFPSSDLKNHTTLTASNIIWVTNYYRVQNGLKPLKQNAKLQNSSAAKSADMFAYQYFDHTRPGSDRTFDYFIDLAHYDFLKIGENLAKGNFDTAKEVVDAWMKSPEHKKNILDPAYTEIGVSVQPGMINGVRTELMVQHFGEPSSNCAQVDVSSQSVIETLKGALANIQTELTAKEGEVASATPASGTAYNDLINEYNDLVKTYNATATEISNLANAYNAQVRAYDKCVRGGA